MSNNNTSARSDELQTIAQSLVNFPEYEAASLAVAKALAVVWQLRLIERTGCTKQRCWRRKASITQRNQVESGA